MNSLHIVVLIVSFLLAAEAEYKDSFTKSDECRIKFPNGFFCSSECQKWPLLKGITIMCLVSNNGEYYRFIARNPTYAIWRFYKINETTDERDLCQAAVNGDKFYLNRTENSCPTREPKEKSLEQFDISTFATEKATDAENESFDSSTEPSLRGNSSFITDIIKRINEHIKKYFKGKNQQPEEEMEKTNYKYSFVKAIHTRKQKTVPMDEVCELLKDNIVEFKKIISCDKDKKCCWDHFDGKAVSQTNMEKYDDCYKAITVAMDGIL